MLSLSLSLSRSTSKESKMSDHESKGYNHYRNGKEHWTLVNNFQGFPCAERMERIILHNLVANPDFVPFNYSLNNYSFIIPNTIGWYTVATILCNVFYFLLLMGFIKKQYMAEAVRWLVCQCEDPSSDAAHFAKKVFYRKVKICF